MMGTDPRASRTSTSSKQTRYVELEGQEATRASESSQEKLVVNGSAKTMAMVLIRTGNGAGRMVQQAAHGVSRNDSKRDR